MRTPWKFSIYLVCSAIAISAHSEPADCNGWLCPEKNLAVNGHHLGQTEVIYDMVNPYSTELTDAIAQEAKAAMERACVLAKAKVTAAAKKLFCPEPCGTPHSDIGVCDSLLSDDNRCSVVSSDRRRGYEQFNHWLALCILDMRIAQGGSTTNEEAEAWCVAYADTLWLDTKASAYLVCEGLVSLSAYLYCKEELR